MELNTDFSKRVVVHSETLDWVPSPMPGVDRRMLDRIGGEVARATTIVRYAPDSHFSPHTHDGGEEFLVLDGVFQDEHGDFPAGSYIRNPPTSSHTPSSTQGCTIFVKLWQFDPDDRTDVQIDANAASYAPSDDEPGVATTLLHEDAVEQVRMERWDADASVDRPTPGGMELLILEGNVIEGGDILSKGSWLRLPKGARFKAQAGPDGVRFWAKTGHLAVPPIDPAAPAA